MLLTLRPALLLQQEDAPQAETDAAMGGCYCRSRAACLRAVAAAIGCYCSRRKRSSAATSRGGQCFSLRTHVVST